MTKKVWNTPTLTAYGSVAQLTEQITVNKTPGAGDTISIQANGNPVADVVGAGSIESVNVDF